jgi:uncharacterized tellurite resistance protein B-like protein
VRIGSRRDEANFTGLIDDLRFYDRALNADDARLLVFQGMMPIVAKSGGKRTQEERDDLRRFYKENYAADYLRSEAALAKARKAKDDLIKAIPTSMIMEEMDPPRETFQLVRGDFRNKGEKVTANTPAFLPPIRKATVENNAGRLRLVACRSNPAEGADDGPSKQRPATSAASADPSAGNTSEIQSSTLSPSEGERAGVRGLNVPFSSSMVNKAYLRSLRN